MSLVNIIPFNRYEDVITVDNFLSDDEIDQIHTHAFTLPIHDATVYGNSSDSVPEYIEGKRMSKVAWIMPSQEIGWLFDKVYDALIAINRDVFHLDIVGTETFQYTTYNSPGGYYGSHKDCSKGPFVRKLSFTIQLTDPETYVGGDVKIYDIDIAEPVIMKKDKGSLTVFLSTILHEVTAVTEGTRQSLVGWASGPALK